MFAVVLTAGTTGMGAIDEIPGVIEFCRREGLWVHVDAAFGGAIAFADQHRVDLFSGNVPDSLTFNPHKLFNVPRGLAVLLCPAGREFRENFSHSLPYIPGEQDWTTRSVVSLNGTGRASGARLLLSLLPLGRAGVAAHIDHYMEVTLALYDHLERDGRWSFVARPRLPHMAFRPTGSPDHALETLHASIRSAGWELSVTRWNGQSWLRFILCRPDLDWRRLAADLSLGLS